MRRPAFLLSGLLFALSLPCARARLAAAEDDASPERPNILFAFADDWGRYASVYGALEPGGPNDVVKTPNFDRVAREGVLFRNAFVNAPSCTPCRSSLLSGQHFWRTGRGAILHAAIWDDSIPTYPLILREHGYHIGQTYKVWSPGAPVDAPYGGNATGYERRGGRMNRFSQVVSRADDAEKTKAEILDEVRGNFRDFLADRKGRPFAYWFGPTNTHRTWVKGSGARLWGIDPESLRGKLPPFLPDVEAVREDFADYIGEVQAFDLSLGVILDELERTGELERTIVVVSGDHGAPGFPRGKCTVYDFGASVPLAIRWGARVPKGRVVDDFVSLPDLAPTFLEAAGITPPEVMTARSLLGVITSEKSGVVDPSRDFAIIGRERHVSIAQIDERPYPVRAIRTGDLLYVRNFHPERWPMGIAPGYGLPDGPMPGANALASDTYAAFPDMDASPTKAWLITHRDEPGMARLMELAFGKRPAEELFDLRKDPHQIVNVADDPAYRDARDRLRERLLDVLRETKDPRVTENGKRFEEPPFAGPVPSGPGPRPRPSAPAPKPPERAEPDA